ncbi:MAG: aminoacyl-tRNA hydrolase [Dechloromonas sp.]|nr:aminoacyl-tRNA hydrolase [Dechloromonas sp.]
MMQGTLKQNLLRVRDALAWRLHRLLGDRVVYGVALASARLWRRLLKKPVFIGVTGSAGKTMTKELMLGILAHKGKGVGNFSSYNNIEEIAKPMLRLRPTHSFFVTELSGDKPNAMDMPLALVQPSIGIVTVVRDDHSSKDYPREAIAEEKGKLIASLPATGTAVLNADDELVLAMAAKSAARVITYGLSPNAELRAEAISSVWPERLQMTLVRGSERVRLRTQLCGTHWVPSVLGAIGGGLAAGMTLDECAKGIASVAPFDGRMQPVTTPDGVTFIRDDYKAPLWTVDACFEFMKEASAIRKIIVIGELQDIASQKGTQIAKTSILAQEIADITIFVGPWASSVLKTRKPGADEILRTFSHVRDASEYINSISRDGDLILLKGANKQDHLLRIILARNGDVACWRNDCNRYSFCNECTDLIKPSGLPVLTTSPPLAGTADLAQLANSAPVERDEQIIVGLGNPESRYAGTPHNVGYEVVERLAASWGLSWDMTPEALIARGSAKGKRVCLAKIQTAMNLTGAGLKRLSESMVFSPEQCILVFDDLDMPIGAVRPRTNGGAGGHRGVASILEAFQTDAIRRVKVGVGKTGGKLDRVSYVLTAFDHESRTVIDQSILTAEKCVLEMVGRPSVAKPH